MSQPEINLIAAVGRSGQLGLGSRMPWNEPDDLSFFNRMTIGGVLICGRKTYEEIKHLDGDSARDILVQLRAETCQDVIDVITSDMKLNHRTIWIVGGATIYRAWLASGLVDRSYITHIDYDGPADVYMPQLWQDARIAAYGLT